MSSGRNIICERTLTSILVVNSKNSFTLSKTYCSEKRSEFRWVFAVSIFNDLHKYTTMVMNENIRAKIMEEVSVKSHSKKVVWPVYILNWWLDWFRKGKSYV